MTCISASFGLSHAISNHLLTVGQMAFSGTSLHPDVDKIDSKCLDDVKESKKMICINIVPWGILNNSKHAS